MRLKFLDKLAVKRTQDLIKTYSSGGSITTYDRAFSDLLKGLVIGGDSEKYVGAVFNAIEVHGFYYTKAKFRLYKKIGDKTEEVIDHKFLNLFNKPNSYETWWRYAYLMAANWGLWGVNYFHVKRNILNKEAFGYQLLPPALIERKNDDKGKWIGYEYNDGNTKVFIPIKDMIEIQYPNPYSSSKGLPIVSTVASQTEVNALQMHYMKKFFENGGFMGLVFTTNQAMTPANFKRTLEMLEQKFKGQDKAYDEVGVFDSGLTPVKAAYSINDMDISGSRKLTKEDIYEAWKVADVMVGRGNMDRAGNEAAILQFTSGIIDPLMSYVDSCFTQFVKNEWKEKDAKENYVVIHDTLAPKDVQAQLKYYETMVHMGAMSINEVRAYEGENVYEHELCNQPIVNVGGALVRLDTGKQIGVENVPANQTNNQQ